MTESQRKWLLDLQLKGVVFDEYHDDIALWLEKFEYLDFTRNAGCYRFSAQPIPDIPDWREVCWDMQSKGVVFEYFNERIEWVKAADLNKEKQDYYRIPAQPLPEWREEMIEFPTDVTKCSSPVEGVENMTLSKEPISKKQSETAPEIPHKDLQIQWHKDKIHSLETGEPMREWECKVVGEEEWFDYAGLPAWIQSHQYRRKPRTVTYWHCVAECAEDMEGNKELTVLKATTKEDMDWEIKALKSEYPTAKFTPIVETTAELED